MDFIKRLSGIILTDRIDHPRHLGLTQIKVLAWCAKRAKPGTWFTASNRQIADAVGIKTISQASKIIDRLAYLGFLEVVVKLQGSTQVKRIRTKGKWHEPIPKDRPFGK